MLRNLFASNYIATESRQNLHTYLHTLKENPLHIAILLAIFLLPVIALGWWYYSFAMSLNAVVPMQPINEATEVVAPDVSAPTDAAAELPVSADPAATNEFNATISNNDSQSTVEVNGQSIPVPENGSTHQVIEDDNGKTTVDISVDSNTSGSGTIKSRSSTNINFDSSSRSKVEIKSKEAN
jgi:hypothetical protein